MDTFSILLLVAIGMILAAYLAQPFFARSGGSGQQRTPQAAELRQRADLLSRRNETYQAILDLEFDYSTSKVSEDDYARQRHTLVAESVGILQTIDTLPDAPEGDRIEAAVAALRRGESPKASTTGVCPHCSQPIKPGDRFCGSCGKPLPDSR